MTDPRQVFGSGNKPGPGYTWNDAAKKWVPPMSSDAQSSPDANWAKEHYAEMDRQKTEQIDPQVGPQAGAPASNPVGGQIMQASIPAAPWYFVPRLHKQQDGPQPPTLADQLFTRGHLGFADQMQGAMEQMTGLNLANQQASLRNSEMQAQLEAARMQSQTPIEVEKIRAQEEALRASALVKALGLMGGGGGTAHGKPRYSSNIGQGINFYSVPSGLR